VNQRPSHSKSTYSQVAPPNNYAPRKVGPRRAEYPPLPEKLTDVFDLLLKFNLVELPRTREDWPAHFDRSKYCQFHRGPGHNTADCYHFRDIVYDLNEKGQLLWAEIRKYLEKNQPQQVQPRPQAEMGIVQNQLPYHPHPQPPQQQQPQAQAPHPAVQPQPPQSNPQVNTIISVEPCQVVARKQTWTLEGGSPLLSAQLTRFYQELTTPPITPIDQSSSSSTRHPSEKLSLTEELNPIEESALEEWDPIEEWDITAALALEELTMAFKSQ